MGRRLSLGRDTRGAAVVEFAIVSPVMILMLMGLGDLAYQVYASSILNGAVQKASRDSALQGGANNTGTIDAKVSGMVTKIAANATIVFDRRAYSSFSGISKPEPYEDTNKNGKRDAKECYMDLNGNNQWDATPDAGVAGQGGGSDVTKYTVTVTYPHLFPVMGLLGWPSTQTITASTLLKNQPYALQNMEAVCT